MFVRKCSSVPPRALGVIIELSFLFFLSAMGICNCTSKRNGVNYGVIAWRFVQNVDGSTLNGRRNAGLTSPNGPTWAARLVPMNKFKEMIKIACMLFNLMLKGWRPNDGVEEAQALYDDTMYYATTIVEDLTLYDIFTLNSIDFSDRKELLSACEDGAISLMLGILGKPCPRRIESPTLNQTKLPKK